MNKLRLALLFGGISGEHEVSCLSAASILRHLDPARYDVTVIGVSREGRWYLQNFRPGEGLHVVADDHREVLVSPGRGFWAEGRLVPLDVVLPITHGVRGEDGCLQGLLECAGVPYCGARVTASALGMDKVYAKLIWEKEGLPVVPSLVFRPADVAGSLLKPAYDRAVASLGSPLFVKPANSGSSVGVAKVDRFEAFSPALAAAFAVDGKVLVETAVDAREIEVAVLGGRDARAYGPGEIVPSHEFYDYDAKYLDPDGAALMVPAPLPPDLAKRILDLAVQAYRALDTVGFARVDFFVSKKGDGLWINEINTLPGFTTISMFPRMAMAGGMSYAQVLDAIVDQALAR